MLKAGMPFKALPTELNRRCGVVPEARGWISHVKSFDVSFTVQTVNHEMIEATTDRGLFAANFELDGFARPFNPAYGVGSAFLKRYPDDFWRG